MSIENSTFYSNQTSNSTNLSSDRLKNGCQEKNTLNGNKIDTDKSPQNKISSILSWFEGKGVKNVNPQTIWDEVKETHLLRREKGNKSKGLCYWKSV